MTPEQCKTARKSLGWTQKRLSAESGVPIKAIQKIEVPTKVNHHQSGDPHAAVRAAFMAAGVHISTPTAFIRVLGLRPPIAKTDGTPERNRHVDVEVDGVVHDVRVKASNGTIRFFEPLLSHPDVDMVRTAVINYLKNHPEPADSLVSRSSGDKALLVFSVSDVENTLA